MKALLCTSLDGPGSLRIADVPVPKLSAGEVVVGVKAVGLNFADTLVTRGKYQYKPTLPFSPGAELCGVVESVSADVSSLKPGDRVMAYVGWGAAAERVAIKAQVLIPVPANVSDEVAAGLSVTYGTAIHGLKDRGRLKAGETVVVTGAAGGAGLAAVEVAKLMEARVIAVVSSAEKLATAKEAGADDGIIFPGCDLKTEVRRLTGGKGADIVYDCIGGEAAEPLVRALAWGGRFLVVGFAAGEIPRLPLNLLLVKGAEAVGVFWGESVGRDPEGHRRGMEQLLEWVGEGSLKPRIHATYPLEKAVEALAVIEGRAARGKVVLTL